VSAGELQPINSAAVVIQKIRHIGSYPERLYSFRNNEDWDGFR